MHPDLRHFVANVLGTAALTLMLVVVTSFLSLPVNLARAPVDTVGAAALERHLT